MTGPDLYQRELQDIAEVLMSVATLPPADAMVRLNTLLDSVGEESIVTRLREARRAAGERAVETIGGGSQAELARILGISEMAVSRAVRRKARPYR